MHTLRMHTPRMHARWMHAIVIAALALGASAATAAEIRVPADHASLQSAIDAAAHGDVILVSPGVYEENIDYLGKSIKLVSEAGPEQTIIDGGRRGVAVKFINFEDRQAELRGFTIRNGLAEFMLDRDVSGGIVCIDSSPTIVDNILTNNLGGWGGALHCVRSSALVVDNMMQDNVAQYGGALFVRRGNLSVEACSFIDNRASLDGGAIVADFTPSLTIRDSHFDGNDGRKSSAMLAFNRASVEVHDSTIRRNDGSNTIRITGNSELLLQNSNVTENTGVAIWASLGTVRLYNDVIANNGGSALWMERSQLRIVHATIFGNTGEYGAIRARSCDVSLVNSIAWGNPSSSGSPIINEDGIVEATYCLVEGGWPGVGNLDVAPRLEDPAGNRMHLAYDSPCVDAGDGSVADLPDQDFEGDDRRIGPAVDIGADEMIRAMSVRYGRVAGQGDGLADVVLVNGSPGDEQRSLALGVDDALAIDLLSPPGGPSFARFCVYAWRGENDDQSITPQPRATGLMAFPTPLQPGSASQPLAIWNNLGHAHRLGKATFESVPAPSRLLSRPDGIGLPVTVTLQGFIEDASSHAEVPVSITNAVVLKIR